MNDLKQKILEQMRQHILASLATVTEDGKPWSRYVVVKADEQMRIWFATFKNSRKIAQIARNREVHLNLGVKDIPSAVSWLQIQGRAEILDDPETKKSVWYDMLSAIFSGPDDPNYVVCKITPYRIEHYMMNKPKPEIWEP